MRGLRSVTKPKVLTMADLKNLTQAEKPVMVDVKLCDGTEARIRTTMFADMSLIKPDTDVYTTFEKALKSTVENAAKSEGKSYVLDDWASRGILQRSADTN